MPSRPAPVDVHRMHTRILIDNFPTEIVLMRHPPLVDDGQGGMRRAAGTDTALPPQKFFLSGLNSNGRSQTAARFDITDEGERFLTRYVIVGMPDADIEEDDWFMYQGRKFQVMSMYPDRSFQTKCEAVTIDG